MKQSTDFEGLKSTRPKGAVSSAALGPLGSSGRRRRRPRSPGVPLLGWPRLDFPAILATSTKFSTKRFETNLRQSRKTKHKYKTPLVLPNIRGHICVSRQVGAKRLRRTVHQQTNWCQRKRTYLLINDGCSDSRTAGNCNDGPYAPVIGSNLENKTNSIFCGE